MIRQRGSVPVEFALAIGVLLLPISVFVLTIAPVVERRNVAGRAAAEAARAYALAGEAVAGSAAADAIISLIDSDHRFDVELVGLDGTFGPGEYVTAAVEVTLPAVVFPGAGEIGKLTYTATHRERIDLYRALP